MWRSETAAKKRAKMSSSCAFPDSSSIDRSPSPQRSDTRSMLTQLPDGGHSLDYLEGGIVTEPLPRQPAGPDQPKLGRTPTASDIPVNNGQQSLAVGDVVVDSIEAGMWSAFDACEGLPEVAAVVPGTPAVVASNRIPPALGPPDRPPSRGALQLRSAIAVSGANTLLLGPSTLRVPRPGGGGGEGGAPDQRGARLALEAAPWVDRRNAWYRRFLENCSENVAGVPRYHAETIERGRQRHAAPRGRSAQFGRGIAVHDQYGVNAPLLEDNEEIDVADVSEGCGNVAENVEKTGGGTGAAADKDVLQDMAGAVGAEDISSGHQAGRLSDLRRTISLPGSTRRQDSRAFKELLSATF